MKRTFVLVTLLVLSLCATNAEALTISDPFYLGHVVDASPASEAAELTYVNSLLDLPAGSAPAPCTLAPSEDCDRLLSTLDASLFADAKLEGALKDESGNNLIDVTGFEYLLAKYGGNAFVWRVGELIGVQELPTNLGVCGRGGAECGLSHITLFHNPALVPEGGATLSLLGLGLFGVGILGRRVHA